jgi:hypothetical protein
MGPGVPHVQRDIRCLRKSYLIASAKPAGGQWRWAVTAPSGLEVIENIELQGNRVGLGTDWQFIKNNWLQVEAGREMGRKITVFAASNPSFKLSLTLEDSWYGRIGYRLSFYNGDPLAVYVQHLDGAIRHIVVYFFYS